MHALHDFSSLFSLLRAVPPNKPACTPQSHPLLLLNVRGIDNRDVLTFGYWDASIIHERTASTETLSQTGREEGKYQGWKARKTHLFWQKTIVFFLYSEALGLWNSTKKKSHFKVYFGLNFFTVAIVSLIIYRVWDALHSVQTEGIRGAENRLKGTSKHIKKWLKSGFIR